MQDFHAPDGAIYSLKHLEPFVEAAQIRVNGIRYEVPVLLLFRDHCFTRDHKDDDHEGWIYPCRGRQKALFCIDRWAFSHGLPALVRQLMAFGSCFRTTNKPRYFKVEKPSHRTRQADEGWYIFFKFEARKNGPGVAMSIESTHLRTNWPANARGRQVLKWSAALAEYLRSRPDILKSLK